MSLMASWVWPFWRGITSGTATPSSAMTSSRTSRTERSRTAENVVDAARLQIGDGGRRDHAAVGDDAGPLDAEPLLKAPHHRHQRGDVGGIAGHQERGDRPVIAI